VFYTKNGIFSTAKMRLAFVFPVGEMVQMIIFFHKKVTRRATSGKYFRKK
jgi:hypothetical protein